MTKKKVMAKKKLSKYASHESLNPDQAHKKRRKKNPDADAGQNWGAYKANKAASEKAAKEGKTSRALRLSKLATKAHLKSVMHDNKTAKKKK